MNTPFSQKFIVTDSLKKIIVKPFLPFYFKERRYFSIPNMSLDKMLVFRLNRKELSLDPSTLNMTVRDGRAPIFEIERGTPIPFPEKKMDVPKNDVLLEVLKYQGISSRIIERDQKPTYNCGNFKGRKFRVATDGIKKKVMSESGQPQVNISDATFIVAYVGDKSHTYSIWMTDEGKESVIKFMR